MNANDLMVSVVSIVLIHIKEVEREISQRKLSLFT